MLSFRHYWGAASLLALTIALATSCKQEIQPSHENLKVNDLEYFEARGVNLLVYSNMFTVSLTDGPDAFETQWGRRKFVHFQLFR